MDINIPTNIQTLVSETLEEWGMDIPQTKEEWEKIVLEFLKDYFRQ